MTRFSLDQRFVGEGIFILPDWEEEVCARVYTFKAMSSQRDVKAVSKGIKGLLVFL